MGDAGRGRRRIGEGRGWLWFAAVAYTLAILIGVWAAIPYGWLPL